MFSFDCAGGREGGQDLIRGVTLWSHLANVGDAKSLIIHPASTTHRQLSDDELRAAGVGPGTVRLSVGLESVDDLIWDLEQAFAAVGRDVGKRHAGGDARLTDLEQYQDPLTIQRVLHAAKTIAIVGLSNERSAGQLLRRLLPQAARLPGDPGEPPRDGDPRRDVLSEPARTCRSRSTS